MSFNIVKFYQDNHINPVRRGKHVTPGWINIDCPFCGGDDGHLGVHISSGAVKCWKCGPHNQIDLIKIILSVDYGTAKDIQKEYATDKRTKYSLDGPKSCYEARNTVCPYPTGTDPMNDRHKAYLRKRGFDADKLEKTWNLFGTNNLGDYKFRIIAPIVFDGITVSYQGRDITDKSELRYKACKKENEIIPHQEIVYGLDYIKGESCLLVEGITDVWRMGIGSTSCFGTSFTISQVNLIASRIKNCFIMFDADDTNAMCMAYQLSMLLSGRGLYVEIVDISDTPSEMLVDPNKGIDPGNLKQEYANLIMKELELI